ncbi:MAG: metallophosphoesterase [Ruminococcaceae bacterium]|nr:metallophosphoesterase [Oscillospiraceae bacterium]
MKRKKRGCISRIAGLLILAIALGVFWWFENETIVTETITVSSAEIPQSFDGFKIAVLADIHGEVFGENSRYLIEKTAATSPDIIVMNGDLIDEVSHLDMLPPLLDGLGDIAPVFFVTGNHEWAVGCIDELFALLEAYGVTVLRNEYRDLTIGSGSIVLAGIDDPNGPFDQKQPHELMAEIAEARSDVFTLMLAHRNDSLDMWSELGCDLVLCGHGHGGVVRIPFVGGLIGVDRSFFPDHTAGLYTKGNTSMVVSRGLGNSVVDFRIFNRPHLLVVELETKPSP